MKHSEAQAGIEPLVELDRAQRSGLAVRHDFARPPIAGDRQRAIGFRQPFVGQRVLRILLDGAIEVFDALVDLLRHQLRK